MPTCSEIVKEVRLENGLSKAKMAARCDLDPDTYRKVENGDRVSELTAGKVAKTVKELCNNTDVRNVIIPD